VTDGQEERGLVILTAIRRGRPGSDLDLG
jgi:hypothetical protein